MDKGTAAEGAITPSLRMKYYKRRDVCEAIVESARDREVGVRFSSGFGRRPSILEYPDDVLRYAMKGATSFHLSEERWHDPLQINPAMGEEESNSLRSGWDLVIDLDGAYFEYSKIAAQLIIRVIKGLGVESLSVKFSGNKGFHIGIPFEAFPSEWAYREAPVPLSRLFPEAPRRIAAYLKWRTSELLVEKVMELEDNNVKRVALNIGLDVNKITSSGFINRYIGDKIVNIDTILLASRHLFRSPYSLHEKSGLASIPIRPGRVALFSREEASPLDVNVEMKFLERNARKNEALRLLQEAWDNDEKSLSEPSEEDNDKKAFFKELRESDNLAVKNIMQKQGVLPSTIMPPCIKRIMEGLNDGRKRALFILINYMGSLGLGYPEIEGAVRGWNKKNREPLRWNYVLSQLSYYKRRKRAISPPSCDNPAYYKDMGICHPDSLCSTIRNPLSYTLKRARGLNRGSKRGKNSVKKKD